MSKTNCANIEINKEKCYCSTFECDKHGVCCECIRANSDADLLPNCLKAKIENSQAYRENIINLVHEAIA